MKHTGSQVLIIKMLQHSWKPQPTAQKLPCAWIYLFSGRTQSAKPLEMATVLKRPTCLQPEPFYKGKNANNHPQILGDYSAISLDAQMDPFGTSVGQTMKSQGEQSRQNLDCNTPQNMVLGLLSVTASPTRWDIHLGFPAVSHRPNCVGTLSNSANVQEPSADLDKQRPEHRSCNSLATTALKRAVPENLLSDATFEDKTLPYRSPQQPLPLFPDCSFRMNSSGCGAALEPQPALLYGVWCPTLRNHSQGLRDPVSPQPCTDLPAGA